MRLRHDSAKFAIGLAFVAGFACMKGNISWQITCLDRIYRAAHRRTRWHDLCCLASAIGGQYNKVPNAELAQ